MDHQPPKYGTRHVDPFPQFLCSEIGIFVPYFPGDTERQLTEFHRVKETASFQDSETPWQRPHGESSHMVTTLW